jgi:hypothetical protein
MRELLPELLEPLLLVFYGALVTVLTVFAVGVELAGLSGISAGFDTVALWELYMGTVGLVAAGVLARREFLPRLLTTF